MKPVGVCMCTRARVHSCLCACDTKFIIVNSQRSSGTTTSKIHLEWCYISRYQSYPWREIPIWPPWLNLYI